MRESVVRTCTLVVGAAMLSLQSMSSAAAAGGTRLVPSGGTTSIRATLLGPDVVQLPELRAGAAAYGAVPVPAGRVVIDRSARLATRGRAGSP